MKKLLIIAVVALGMTGCASVYHMGMSEQEFVKKNIGYRVIEMNQYRTVYRRQEMDMSYTFVYVQNGQVVAVDKGVPSPNMVIENNHYSR